MTATRRHTVSHTQQHSFTLDPPIDFTVTSERYLARGQQPRTVKLDHLAITWSIGGHHGPDLDLRLNATSTADGWHVFSDGHEPALLELFADLIADTRPVVVTASGLGDRLDFGIPIVVSRDTAPLQAKPMHPAFALAASTDTTFTQAAAAILDALDAFEDHEGAATVPATPSPAEVWHRCQHVNQAHACTCTSTQDHSSRVCVQS